MADKTRTRTAKTRGSALDLPMAALAGGSVGFFVFAMPADLFERLVGATRVASVVSAAQPPLGDTARLAIVIAAALAVFGATWLLLRALGRPAVARAEPAREEEEPSAPPRLRRFDKHPDAPARSPIRAGSDFGVPLDSIVPLERGEPVDVSEVENVDFEAEWERPTPSFLTPASEPIPVEEQTPRDPDRPEPGETYDAVHEDASVDVPFWVPEGAQEPTEEEDREEEEAPQVEEPLAARSDAPTILPFWAQHIQNEPVDDAANEPEASLDELSNRLEGGLIRRKREGRSTRPRGHRGTDDRLRSAVEDLGKITGRR